MIAVPPPPQAERKMVVLTVKIPFSGSMLETEEGIQTILNEAGTIASGEALQEYDTDGSPIEIAGRQWTSKGTLPKTYQTPYGAIEVLRHVYQSSAGGVTYCPLEVDSRIIVTSTPRFAKQISHKYAEMSGGKVIEDLVRRVEKIETAVEPRFQEFFVEAMAIPNLNDPFERLQEVVTLPERVAVATEQNARSRRGARRA